MNQDAALSKWQRIVAKGRKPGDPKLYPYTRSIIAAEGKVVCRLGYKMLPTEGAGPPIDRIIAIGDTWDEAIRAAEEWANDQVPQS